MSDLAFAAVLILAAACIVWIAADARREQRDRRFDRHADEALKISGPGSAPAGARVADSDSLLAPRSSTSGEDTTPGRSLHLYHPEPEWDLP